MKHPTFNKNGYPTEETLLLIEQWPFNDFLGLIDFIEEAWKYPERVKKLVDFEGRYKDVLYLSTGGWSGNEDLINALMGNYMMWGIYWIRSERGGHYWFEIK